MQAQPTRRQLLRAGLAAGAGATLTRYAPWAAVPATADAMPPAERRALGLPVGAASSHGDSSIAAAIRSGVIPRNSPLETVVRSLQSLDTTDDGHDSGGRPRNPEWRREPSSDAGRRLRSRFRDLRRHFVFEYYPWYQVQPYDHWNEGGHRPPFDIAAPLMPALGPYDSGNANVIASDLDVVVILEGTFDCIV